MGFFTSESVKSRDLMGEENIGKMVTTMEQKFRENVAEMFDVMKHSFMFKYALSHTRVYTGSNIPLKDLVEDIRKGEAVLHEDIIPAYVTALVFKLEGQARAHTYGRVFETTDELINHLKNEFEPHIQIPPRVPKEQKPTNPPKTVTIRDLY